MNKFKNSVRRKHLLNRLLNYFFKGLLISLPLAATVAGIFWLFTTVDNFLGEDHFPGLGILIILSVILMIGIIGSSYIVQPFINWFEEWLEKNTWGKISLFFCQRHSRGICWRKEKVF
jgi:hypothetical protein